jgi:UDP-glucose 4-epimerase
MRILITGGAGFLGYHLTRMLLDLGHEVTILDNLSTGTHENLHPGAAFCLRDVREPLHDLFREVRPERIIHLAAQVSVARSVAHPQEDLDINVQGTVNLLEAAAATDVGKLVFVSSAAVYGTPAAIPVTEESPTRPLSPYGLSKLTAEGYTRLMGEQRGLAWTILRPANIYGPGQTTDGEGAVVPAFLQQFMKGRSPVVHGAGRQTRDFIHVRDMARAVIQALSHGDGRILNISSGTESSVLQLWERLAALTGWRQAPVHGPERPGDISRSLLSNRAAYEALAWRPEIPLEKGLAETVAWLYQQQVATTRE